MKTLTLSELVFSGADLIIIQYNAIRPDGIMQGFLKEVSKQKYNDVYVPAFKSGKITDLSILY